MIWIATLLLVVVAAWLIMEGQNERRWVQDHLDDEMIAADKGLWPQLAELQVAPEPEARYSVAGDHSRIGRLAAKAKEQTAKLGDKLDRQPPTSGNQDSKRQHRAARGAAMTGSDSLIGRVAERLTEKSDAVTSRIPEGRLVSDSADGSQAPSRARKAINAVTNRLEQIDGKASNT